MRSQSFVYVILLLAVSTACSTFSALDWNYPSQLTKGFQDQHISEPSPSQVIEPFSEGTRNNGWTYGNGEFGSQNYSPVSTGSAVDPALNKQLADYSSCLTQITNQNQIVPSSPLDLNGITSNIFRSPNFDSLAKELINKFTPNSVTKPSMNFPYHNSNGGYVSELSNLCNSLVRNATSAMTSVVAPELTQADLSQAQSSPHATTYPATSDPLLAYQNSLRTANIHSNPSNVPHPSSVMMPNGQVVPAASSHPVPSVVPAPANIINENTFADVSDNRFVNQNFANQPVPQNMPVQATILDSNHNNERIFQNRPEDAFVPRVDYTSQNVGLNPVDNSPLNNLNPGQLASSGIESQNFHPNPVDTSVLQHMQHNPLISATPQQILQDQRDSASNINLELLAQRQGFVSPQNTQIPSQNDQNPFTPPSLDSNAYAHPSQFSNSESVLSPSNISPYQTVNPSPYSNQPQGIETSSPIQPVSYNRDQNIFTGETQNPSQGSRILQVNPQHFEGNTAPSSFPYASAINPTETRPSVQLDPSVFQNQPSAMTPLSNLSPSSLSELSAQATQQYSQTLPVPTSQQVPFPSSLPINPSSSLLSQANQKELANLGTYSQQASVFNPQQFQVASEVSTHSPVELSHAFPSGVHVQPSYPTSTPASPFASSDSIAFNPSLIQANNPSFVSQGPNVFLPSSERQPHNLPPSIQFPQSNVLSQAINPQAGSVFRPPFNPADAGNNSPLPQNYQLLSANRLDAGSPLSQATNYPVPSSVPVSSRQ